MSNRDGNNEIYVMSKTGTGQTNISVDGGDDNSPDWSAGGSKIVFTTDRDGNFEVYSMSATGADPTNLTNNATDDGNGNW